MLDPHDETTLEKTKMSFSEHLDELRRALIKSFGVLVIGFLIGLMMGWSVIRFIQTPLRDALEKYYQNHAEVSQLHRLKEMRDAGLPVPDDLEAAAKKMADERLVPREFYVDATELRRALDDRSPVNPSEKQTPDDSSASAADLGNIERSDLLRLRVYQPLEEDVRLRVVGLSVQEGFMVYVKASLVAGVLISSPFIFYFIWEFVASGLYHHERRHIYIFLPMSLGLFLAGAALAFFVVFDYVLEFLFWFYTQMGIDPDPRISEWISFVLMLPLGFGISFQLPLVMLFLERVGVFSVEIYWKKWRIAVLVIAVLSMFLTPADPGSMILMAVPLTALYFGGIALCRFMPRSSPAPSHEPPTGEATGS